VRGAWLNVQINAATLKDKSLVTSVLTDGAKLVAAADARETALLAAVDARI
jgi:formiminotetrahydrofolate cyclodeaminase